MNLFLDSNPVIVSDILQSFDWRTIHNSNGRDQAEAFISEGPDLAFVDPPDIVNFNLPLELIQLPGLEVIKV